MQHDLNLDINRVINTPGKCEICGHVKTSAFDTCNNMESYSLRYKSSTIGRVILAHNDTEAIEKAQKIAGQYGGILSLNQYMQDNIWKD